MKRTIKKSKKENLEIDKVAIDNKPTCSKHNFTNDEVSNLHTHLLSWFDSSARDLPWRTIARTEKDHNKRGYSVLVSEMMLQQTQVATVISYYNKWMDKWPDTKSLASASLDQVNEMWAGLGYYSRGRRLWEGAIHVEKELNGIMPRTAEELLKLPGVGRYTSAAVASIAYNEKVGLVDGNVVRVLTRMRAIGADSTSQTVTDSLWKSAQSLVEPGRPGDLNQALMELGATVCSPRTPSCGECPVKELCAANMRVIEKDVGVVDVEDCGLCVKGYDASAGVLNYPRKEKKAASRSETTLVCVLACGKVDSRRFAVFQRPKKGLLANMFEFFSVNMGDKEMKEKVEESALEEGLKSSDIVMSGGLERVGEVIHIFSHINMKYVVWRGEVEEMDGSEWELGQYQSSKWVSREEFLEASVPTGMKKVLKLYDAPEKKEPKKRKREDKETNQRSISSFFQPQLSKVLKEIKTE